MTEIPSGDEAPFDSLRLANEPRDPRPRFTRDLRARLVDRLGFDAAEIPVINLPERRTPMPITSLSSATPVTATIYLTVSDGPGAIDWYTEALGATEQMRVVGDDGRIGHAELTIGTARIMLSSEYPEMGVVAPTTLGGTPFAIHLDVPDVDTAFARAVSSGATAQAEPTDQPHGARHGAIIDPYGHRWMLSQALEVFDLDTYAKRSEGSGFTVEAGPGADLPATDRARNGGLWSVLYFDDCPAAIRWYVDVLGFDEALVVTDENDPTVIVHSELRWPEGGIIQLAPSGEPGPERHQLFARPAGNGSLYVITDDPRGVHDRLSAAGVEIVLPFEVPHYDPDGGGFTIRDIGGNLISFGSYGGVE